MPRKTRKNVGVIGLGIIGTRAAAGLRAGGFQVFVWNRTPKPAPNFVGSPAEVAELCDIIQIFVADAQALFDVLDAMSDTLSSRHIIVCNSTVGPEATLEAARLVEDKGAKFLDAPFTGSKGAAEKRDLVYYVGGDEATFLRAKPVLEATSRAIVRIGEIGHAATVKVVTNMISAVSTQVLAEALAIVQKAGLDAEVLAHALEYNACRSGTIEMKLPKMVTGDYDPHFSLKHMFKDVQLGIHIANALDIEIPTTTVTAGVMFGALNHGWAELDFASLYKVYEPQLKPNASLAELPPVVAKLEDLDSRETHYRETVHAAPPRPLIDAPPAEVPPLVEVPKPVEASEPSKTDKTEDAKTADAPKDAPAAPASTDSTVIPVVLAALSPFVPNGTEGENTKTLNADTVPPTPVTMPTAIGETGFAEKKDEASGGKDEPPAAGESGAAPVVIDFMRPLVVVPVSSPAEEPRDKAESGSRLETAQARSGEGKPFNFVRRWFVTRNGG